MLSTSCSSESASRFEVKEGKFKASVLETGDLQAINSLVITMPFLGWQYGWQFKITDLADHGKKVKAGDIIVEIDPSSVLNYLEDQETRQESEEANLNKMLVSQSSTLSQLQSEYSSEKANHDLIQLQLEKLMFESEKKKLQKELQLKIAKIKLQNIEDKIENKKVVFANELKIQKIRLKQIAANVAGAKEAYSKLSIPAPIDGIVQLEYNWRSKRSVQIGDEIHQGGNITNIPDMRKMKVHAAINETDISKIFIGQKAIIRLDAFPDKEFTGSVETIAKLSREKDKNSLIKVFDFEVVLDGRDEALKPGMTVSCELITDQFEKVNYVENECVFNDAEGFFVITRSNKRIPIKILAANNNFTAIEGDINNGQALLCSEEYKASLTQ